MEYVKTVTENMAIFMPLDSNLPHLSFNNILKYHTPTHIFNKLMHKRDSEESFMLSSNIFGTSNDITRTMTDDKHKSLAIHLDVINNDESCNSTDSDLSVGQEKIDDDKSETNFDQMETETVENKTPNNAEDDNSSNASSSQYTNTSTRLCNPQNTKDCLESPPQMSMMHPNPVRLQEEIFRNSQLYAEELVRQQLAAAARLQSISGSKIFSHMDPTTFNEKQRMLLASDELEPSSKLNFQSSVFAPKPIDNNQNGSNLFCNNKSAINFQNIHSHLSAISQITNNLTSSIKKDDSTSLSSLSRESSQSPSSFQHLKQHHQNMIFHTHQNQLHERNLKFSIDNILKADFGRRITEPLLRSSKARKRDGKQDKDLFKKFNAPAATKDSFDVRESPRVPESSPSNQSPSSAEQSKSESKGSGSGTVWPAWVNLIFSLFTIILTLTSQQTQILIAFMNFS